MATVEVRHLSKQFVGNATPAVDDLDLATGEGEYLVLLGPSGCGKTTLLRLIAGLEQPTSGEVYIGGEPMVGLPPRARKIAMVFQSYALYPHKTARKNIEFPLRAAGMAPEERAQKIEWAAELLGITRLLDRRPRHLSGGERQRVALARALVREPDVFLLDEPLSNLDAKLRATARDDLKQFQDRVDTTTIYVTHDQVEAMGLGDRIAVMSEGRIRQLGTPVEVYDDPADTFVATFLGSPPMNIVERDDVIVGFRPESLLPKGVVDPDEDAVTVAFDVSRVEYLGAERQAVGTVEGFGPPTRAIALLPANVSVPVPAGETSDFVVRGADLRFFHKATGLRAPRMRL
ncbi:MAG: multiple sugar transport system ATP-binding protein [Actinomycetota bacterium]|jgi:multiple sugar transport system ATP-binding protein|nr:multiple sugar transport system ATP-binding protein [Actinomycetota bacterium]